MPQMSMFPTRPLPARVRGARREKVTAAMVANLRPTSAVGFYWVRLGDVGEYESFDDIRDALESIYAVTGDRKYYRVRGGLVFPGLFEGQNYVSLYYGDKNAKWIRDLIPSELGAKRYKPQSNPRASRARFERTRIAMPGEFDPRSFRTIFSGTGRHGMVVGCPKSHFHPERRGRRKCDVGMEAQSVLRLKGNPATVQNPLLMLVPNPLHETRRERLKAQIKNPGPKWHRERKALYGEMRELMRQTGKSGMEQSYAGAEYAEAVALAGPRRNPDDMGSLTKLPRFKQAVELFRKFHGTDPQSVKRVLLPIGSKDKIDGREVFVSLGKAPAESYDPPAFSRKAGNIYVHPYERKPEKVVSADGRTVMTLPGSHKVTDWIRG